MTDCALHIQRKDREVFDRENRVIPQGVVAVSHDTGGFRFGDGKTRWRDLTAFGNDNTGSISENPTSGYSGRLHVTVFTDEELDNDVINFETYIPEQDEMVILGTKGMMIGNGSISVDDSPWFAPISMNDEV